MLLSRSTIVWLETTTTLRHKDNWKTHRKISEQPFALWEVRLQSGTFSLIWSLLVVAALVPKLPCSIPMLKLLSTMWLMVTTLINPLKFRVSSLSEECSETRLAVNWMIKICRTNAKVDQEKTTHKISELLQTSHRWLFSQEQQTQSLHTSTAKRPFKRLRTKVFLQHWSPWQVQVTWIGRTSTQITSKTWQLISMI